MARIILIEDSPTDRAVFSQWLEKAGHTVVATDNAEEGLELIRSQAPDLVLMDVVLPGMSGFQATRALARDQATKDHPRAAGQHQGHGNGQGLGIAAGCK